MPGEALSQIDGSSQRASLILCNATIREIAKDKYSVELTKPSALMKILGEPELEVMAKSADASLVSVLENWKRTFFAEFFKTGSALDSSPKRWVCLKVFRNKGLFFSAQL